MDECDVEKSCSLWVVPGMDHNACDRVMMWLPLLLRLDIMSSQNNGVCFGLDADTVKPVCNDHLYNKIYYLRFIQECVLMKTECTNLLMLTISGHLDELQKAEKDPIRWSL